MTKELSISNIKEELLSRIKHDADIRCYMGIEEIKKDLLAELNNISDIDENILFFHDNDYKGDMVNYVTIEAEEQEYKDETGYGVVYPVKITVGFENPITNVNENLDKCSERITNIVRELFPKRYNLTNKAKIINDKSTCSHYPYFSRVIQFVAE